MRTGSPAPASTSSFTPAASLQLWTPNWSVFLDVLLVRLVQLGTAWPHRPGGGSPPGQISCLELTKGCRAGWIWKARVANFIWKQVGTTTVITTVLCIVCASRLFRNQTALAKRVGKNIQTQFPWYHFYAPLISECRVYITIKVIFR